MPYLIALLAFGYALALVGMGFLRSEKLTIAAWFLATFCLVGAIFLLPTAIENLIVRGVATAAITFNACLFAYIGFRLLRTRPTAPPTQKS